MLEVIEKEIEWPTLSFFAFLFIAVGAAVQTGLIDTIAGWLSLGIQRGGALMGLAPAGMLLFAALLICWTGGVLSAFIDNIPFVAVAIPIVARLSGELSGDTTVLWWALSLGACLGGNATVVGASANVTVTGLAERSGYRVSFREFSRFGAPVAVMTLVIASAWLALHVFVGAIGALVASLIAFALLVLVRFTGRRETARLSAPHRG